MTTETKILIRVVIYASLITIFFGLMTGFYMTSELYDFMAWELLNE